MQVRKTAILVFTLGLTGFLKHDIEGNIEGGIEMTVRRERRRKQLLDDHKDEKGYLKLKEEALDRTIWRTGIERGCGPVVRETAE
jgi:hypothetical protein